MAFSIAPSDGLVVGADHEHAGLGHLEPSDLLERHLTAVVVDEDLLHQGGGGAAGADAGELLAGVLHGLPHLLVRIVEHELDELS